MKASKPGKKPANSGVGIRKRKPVQMLADRTFIAHKRMQGWTLFRIVAGVNEKNKGVYTLSQTQVYEDQRFVENEWRERMAVHADIWKAKEMAELDRMGDEMWAQYEQSKVQRRQASVELNGPETGTQTLKKSKVVTEDREGDPRYMELILKIQDRRAKLLGLNAPVKLENSDGSPLGAVSLAPIFNVTIAAQETEAT